MSLTAGSRPDKTVKHWTVRFLDVELRLSNGKSLRGEVGTYLPLPAEGRKGADSVVDTGIRDVLIVGTSSDTGLEATVSLYDADRMVFQRK
jgi:hypothetical protein